MAFIDLTGQTFGRLTVIKRVENSKEGRARWLCECSCGNTTITLGKCLRSGHTQSCGCYNKEKVSKISLNDIRGQRYGRLVVESRAEDYISPKGIHHVVWNCVCDCGNKLRVDVNDLRRGHTKSCGCLRTDFPNRTTHGGRKDRLYGVLSNMKSRCYNPHDPSYKYYGGRGIVICDDWFDYANFKKWAYENGYNEDASFGECTIDRIDVDGNYEPSNCRWVSLQVQAQNKQNNKYKIA